MVDLMVKMREDKKTKVEAIKESEDVWVKELKDEWYSSLFPPTDSWYQVYYELFFLNKKFIHTIIIAGRKYSRQN